MKMRIRFLSLLAFAIPSTLQAGSPGHLADYRVGELGDASLDEASGLACAESPGTGLWAHNDSGNGEWLFRLAPDGHVIEKIRVEGGRNRDWEDMSVIRSDTGMQIVIADIGDNASRRSEVRLLVTNAPRDMRDGAAKVTRTIRLTYPDGPRDTEALAIDSESRIAWLLTKRDIPARLYTVPLDRPAADLLIARYEGTLDTLPQPSPEDIAAAPGRKDWFWQPTAMDFSADRRLAAVLTYEAIYVFERRPGESWREAFGRAPRHFRLGKGFAAEALCLTGTDAYWTTEGAGSPVFRIPLSDSRWTRP